MILGKCYPHKKPTRKTTIITTTKAGLHSSYPSLQKVKFLLAVHTGRALQHTGTHTMSYKLHNKLLYHSRHALLNMPLFLDMKNVHQTPHNLAVLLKTRYHKIHSMQMSQMSLITSYLSIQTPVPGNSLNG